MPEIYLNKLTTLALEARLVKYLGLVSVVVEVGVVGRLKKWVKTVENVFLFSMVFAHVCEAIFKLSINCKSRV